MRSEHRLGAHRWIGMAQLIEYMTPEDHRVAMPATVAGPRDRYMRGGERRQQNPDGVCCDQRQIDRRNKHASDAGSIRRVQTGNHRRQLPLVGTRVLREPRPRKALDCIAKRPIVRATDDQHVRHSTVNQRGGQRLDKGRSVRECQQWFRPAHSRRSASRQDDAWDHEGDCTDLRDSACPPERGSGLATARGSGLGTRALGRSSAASDELAANRSSVSVSRERRLAEAPGSRTQPARFYAGSDRF